MDLSKYNHFGQVNVVFCTVETYLSVDDLGVCLTLTVPVTTIDALRHFETG